MKVHLSAARAAAWRDAVQCGVGVAALCWWSQPPESRDLQYAIQDALAQAVGAQPDDVLSAVVVCSI